MQDSKSQQPKYIYNNYSNSSRHRPLKPKKARNKLRKSSYSILIFLLIGLFVWYFIPSSKVKDKTKAIISVIHPSSKKTTAPPPVNAMALTNMQNAVNNVIQSNPKITFEVAVTNLNDGSQLNFGQSAPMTAASVSKIITATDYLKEVELGNDTMNESLDDGNTASYDMRQLIVISSDSAWAAFDNRLTPNQLQNYATSIGVTSFNYVNNTLTARDTANVLSALYQGKLLNQSDTNLLLGYLKQANYRTYILPAIPSSDTVYHKIGLYIDSVNDATIITNGTNTISLVIFTNGNGEYDWPERAVLMQDITKPILTYYNLN